MTNFLVILCGGYSVRMGKDKATLQLKDETLLARHVRLAKAAGLTVVLASNGRNYGITDTLSVADAIADQGPLSALIGALEMIKTQGGSGCFLMPVDTLIAPSALVELFSSALPATWLTLQEGEQLHSVFAYANIALLPHLRANLAQGINALSAISRLNTAKTIAMPTAWQRFIGFNTPAQWHSAKAAFLS